MSTPMAATPARLADSQSHVESPSMTASPPPAFSTAAATRAGSGLVASHAPAVVPAPPRARHGGAARLAPSHPDVAVDAPHRQHDPVLAERPVPRQRVLVVR